MTNDHHISPRPRVQVYSLSTCSHCAAVKDLLIDHGIDCDIVEVDLLIGDDRKRTIERVRQLNPKVSFPTTVIDGDVIVGNKQARIKKRLDAGNTRRGG